MPNLEGIFSLEGNKGRICENISIHLTWRRKQLGSTRQRLVLGLRTSLINPGRFHIKIMKKSFSALEVRIKSYDSIKGHFTHWKKRTRFFSTKGFLQIFDGIFLKTKGFLPKVYEIFGSEMPLDSICC